MDGRDTLELQVGAEHAALESTRLRVLAHIAGHAGLADDRRTVYALELVLEEWLSNVFRHGGVTQVGLRVTVDPDGIALRFVDDGPPFDPTERPHPERPANLEEAQPGGLGLFLIERYARSWRYARQDGRNLMHIVIGPAPAASAPPA